MKRLLSILLVFILTLGTLSLACAEEEALDTVFAMYRLEGMPVRYLMGYYEDIGWNRYIYWDMVDEEGNTLMAHFADRIYASPGGWYAVKIDDSWYIMNAAGEIKGEPVFEEIESFQPNGLVAVKQDGLWGLIRADGSWFVEPQYDEDPYHWYNDMLWFSNGVAVAILDGKYGYLREDGSYLFEPQFDDANDFPEDDTITLVKKNDLYGYVTIDGSILFEPQFEEAYDFDGDIYAIIGENGKEGYVNRNGEIVISPRFDKAFGFSGDYALVKQDGLYGYIDREGNIAVEPSFTKASKEIYNGIAAVCVDGKLWGYIKMDGEYLFEPQFDRAEPFICGVAAVKLGSNTGLVSKDGSILLEPEYSRIYLYRDGEQYSFFDYYEWWVNVEDEEKEISPEPLDYDFVVIAEKGSEVYNYVLIDGIFTQIPVVRTGVPLC